MRFFLVIVTTTMMLLGCTEKPSIAVKETAMSQDSSCYFMDVDHAKSSCKNGQIAVFVPSRWGNEQLPVVAASSFCDFRFSIVHTNGGVSCVFTDARLKEKVVGKKDGVVPAK
jgi:hypothetical protein